VDVRDERDLLWPVTVAITAEGSAARSIEPENADQ